jgi:hypothetical protein
MLGEAAHERDLERGLLEHLRKFLLELGVGFAFVGTQYPLTVGGEEFRIDLLFTVLSRRYSTRTVEPRKTCAESGAATEPSPLQLGTPSRSPVPYSTDLWRRNSYPLGT